ncbi:MAG: LacI family DNA-binding transcriptional regulator [Acidobacteriales bacterium]|nr:LacI family DNA-binding transcriptional regulator [Candidatus Koribacter versatilis]MBI3645298.1 LacI family DNA-binding transcriptional regulator [Terriglobales bacterium]
MGKGKEPRISKPGAVTLRAVAERVGLAPGTVSAVLNDAPSARSIPEHTRLRIQAAAQELNYRPNFFARSLRKKRTYTIGLIVEEIGDAYGSMIVSGVEAYLRQHNYFFLTVIHRHDLSMLLEYSQLLVERGVEGFITVDTSLQEPPSLPTVSVAGHRELKGVTNIVLDQETGARLALEHLVSQGHRQIAFMKGQPYSSDSEERWQAVCRTARQLDLAMDPDLIVRLEVDDPSPQLGYPYAKQLLARKKPFTALFAYNDISAIGAIRAFHEAGLRVPDDISVVGFDDIREAAYHSPSLTTVHQPLRKMGEIAAQTVLERIESGTEDYPHRIAVEPVFVVRESTAKARVQG